MASVEERLDRLDRRNAVLELQNRRMKQGGLAAAVVAGAALLMAPAGARDQGGDAVKAKSIEATTITLIDGAGKTRIEIGVDKDGAGLDVRDANGKTRVVIGEGAVEGLGQGAGLWVFDDQERPRVGLGIGKDGSGLVVLDENGKPVAAQGKEGK